ncbi:MAG: ester cyclase [Colwellia sp.]|uniref:nuclear transport factor 2 family protein n=1 Tax=Colwellia sp. TaxID=56799 RepID=UPI0025B7BD95|nr:ester cyclase [Colwellia sp.]NQZ27091.1 ester cyclase [Colwellia sp.]
MNIIKLVSIILLLGVTACAEEEKANKVVVEQIYTDVINGLNTGLVTSLYAEDFIQHNTEIVAGVAGQEEYFEAMITNNPNHVATIKHIVADGDYVAVHWHYAQDVDNEFIGSARVDLYKLSDSVITEHWDVTMTPNMNTASGNSVFSDLYIYPTNTYANTNRSVEEINKLIITDFYLDLFNNKNLDLIDELVDPSYLQHNYWVPNGSDGLYNFVSGGGTGGLSIFLTLAEGDLIWTFSGPGTDNLQTVDLWRLDNNIKKIVEHWDVF